MLTQYLYKNKKLVKYEALKLIQVSICSISKTTLSSVKSSTFIFTITLKNVKWFQYTGGAATALKQSDSFYPSLSSSSSANAKSKRIIKTGPQVAKLL